MYRPENALLVLSGDITADRGKELASKLLEGWKGADAKPPQADYTLPENSSKRRVILVDNPAGQQSAIRIGTRAYDAHNDKDKWPGSVAGRILSAGIDSRLGKYVRAEKGYTYGAYATFQPARHGGEFAGDVDTNPQTTAPCVEAMFKVFNDMRKENVTDQELADAKSRVAGGMVMEMETIGQQAGRRIDQILNDYPIDYWDKYPQRIAQVTADQVRDVMNKYVSDDMTIVIVGPAQTIEEQVKTLGGDQKKIDMPLKDMPQMGMGRSRSGGATTKPASEAPGS
jgi:predicted Zn-dependent peptidase